MFGYLFIVLITFWNLGVALNSSSDDEIKGVVDRTAKLAPGATVNVRGIEGPVVVETSNSQIAEIHWTRTAKSQRDYDCETIDIDEQPNSLEILHRTDRSCHIIQAHEALRLVLPKTANFKINGVEGALTISELAGSIDVQSVEGDLKVGSVHAAMIQGVEGDVSLGLSGEVDQDLLIRNIEGNVDLALPSALNADIRLRGITGKVDWGPFAPSGAHAVNEHAYITFGRGGRTISVLDVEGSLRLRAKS